MSNKNNHISSDSVTDKIAGIIANSIIKLQYWFTNHLKSFTKNWNAKHQWFFMVMVCIFFGGLSIVVMVQSFEMPSMGNGIIPSKITRTKNSFLHPPAFVITQNEFIQVQQYKLRHPDLLKTMPGLYDSLTGIEEIYLSQKNKYHAK